MKWEIAYFHIRLAHTRTLTVDYVVKEGKCTQYKRIRHSPQPSSRKEIDMKQSQKPGPIEEKSNAIYTYTLARSLIQTHVKKFKHTELQIKFKKNVLRECRRVKGTLSLIIEEKENIHTQHTSFLALYFPCFICFKDCEASERESEKMHHPKTEMEKRAQNPHTHIHKQNIHTRLFTVEQRAVRNSTMGHVFIKLNNNNSNNKKEPERKKI